MAVEQFLVRGICFKAYFYAALVQEKLKNFSKKLETMKITNIFTPSVRFQHKIDIEKKISNQLDSLKKNCSFNETFLFFEIG